MAIIDKQSEAFRAMQFDSWQQELARRITKADKNTSVPNTVFYTTYDPLDMNQLFAAKIYSEQEVFTTPVFTDHEELLDYIVVVTRMNNANQPNDGANTAKQNIGGSGGSFVSFPGFAKRKGA